jgi:hypothetical protein
VAPTQSRILRLKTPGNKRSEAAGFFLQLVEPLEMIHAVLVVLADSEHHCGRGSHSQLVCGAMHVEPIVSQAFQARDLVANFVVENLRSAAWDGIQTRLAIVSRMLSSLYSAIAIISEAE